MRSSLPYLLLFRSLVRCLNISGIMTPGTRVQPSERGLNWQRSWRSEPVLLFLLFPFTTARSLSLTLSIYLLRIGNKIGNNCILYTEGIVQNRIFEVWRMDFFPFSPSFVNDCFDRYNCWASSFRCRDRAFVFFFFFFSPMCMLGANRKKKK